jgi:hypothetical protein
MKFVAAGAIGGVMLGILWGSGCKHAPKGGVYGNTSFRVVEPPRPPPPPGSSREMIEPVSRANYRDAQAIHPLVMPVYPPAALAARAGAATVGVRVTVDASGVVTDVRPSMLAVTITPPEFAEAFREAVEVAVRRWKFAPARALLGASNRQGVHLRACDAHRADRGGVRSGVHVHPGRQGGGGEVSGGLRTDDGGWMTENGTKSQPQ